MPNIKMQKAGAEVTSLAEALPASDLERSKDQIS
jgi:hypothetical protein